MVIRLGFVPELQLYQASVTMDAPPHHITSIR
jgi:hypothetical protein